MKVTDGRVPAEPGSREPSPAVSALSGFDPSRVVAAWQRYDNISPEDFQRNYVAEAICRACVLAAYPDAPELVEESLIEAFAAKCLPEADAAIAALRELDASWVKIASADAWKAIATEAGTAETGTGSVHEGAGLQGIAQGGAS